jgi:DNA-3-methyladenine glycosylase
MTSKRLDQSFFQKLSCEGLAEALLGKRLVRILPNGSKLVGEIIETEAYLGVGIDKASHSYSGKHTPRNSAMFMRSGTIYVYSIYGMYVCMNFSSEGEGAAVLLRALRPVQGSMGVWQGLAMDFLKYC